MRKDGRSISIVAILTTCAALICSANIAEAADPFLWPLKNGQWMEFLVQSPDPSPAWKAQIKVTGSKTAGDTQYFSVEVPVWSQGTQETVFLRSSEKGLYRLETEGECPVADLDRFGATFKCRTSDGGWEVTTLLAEVALTVPAGTFTTARLFRKQIEYDNRSMSPDWDIYVVPGLGPVKQVEYGGNFDGQSAPAVVRTIELMQVGTSPEIPADALKSVPAGPDAKAESSSTRAEGDTRRVATLGVVVEVRPSSFILKQESLNVSFGKMAMVRSVKHDLAIGYADNLLEVLTNPATQINVGGTLLPLSALRAGTRVIVAGMAGGESLMAVTVSDLSMAGPPPEEATKSIIQAKGFGMPIPSAPVAVQEEPATGALPVCLGQHMDYGDDPNVAEFQGCFGGPSISGTIPTFDFPIYEVPLLGKVTLHAIHYDIALGGWRFDFPFRFSASSNNLTYHVPSSVSLNVESLKATEGETTFEGGLGANFDLDIDYMASCFPEIWNLCDYDLTHYSINFLSASTIHNATGPGPIQPGQKLVVAEDACPESTILGIDFKGVKIPLLTVGFCTDILFINSPFEVGVNAKGKKALGAGVFDFVGSNKELTLTPPDSLSVDIEFVDPEWTPGIDVGIYVQLAFLGQYPFLKAPTIPILNRSFLAITTPFPFPATDFSLAADPLSPVGAPEYLYQPVKMTITLPVAPAPTHLTMIPANALLEGEPVQACLQEDHLNVPVAGQTVNFTTGMPGGQAGITVSATTGADGIAKAIFPAGEHKALHAVWGGNSYYRASASSGLNVTITAAPDLTGQWQSLDRKCSYRNKRPNCKISGKLKIENIGSLKAPKSVVRFYLSDDKVYDQGDTLLKQMAIGILGPGKSSTKTLNYTIPSGGTAGGKYIIAVIDADHAVLEYNGDNQIVFGPFEVIVF